MDMVSIIHDYVVNECNDGIEIRDDDPIIDRGILDSLRVLNLISFLEETFEIEIDLSEIDATHFQSVESIVSLVRSKTVLEDGGFPRKEQG